MIIPIQPFAIKEGTKIANNIADVPEDKLPVMEMFYGIEGEGADIGEPRILLRVGGCRISCTGCDTPHSWGLKSSKMKSMAQLEVELLTLVNDSKVRTVAITGGEPMHYPAQISQLAQTIAGWGLRSWLETSGLLLDSQVFDQFGFLSIDVKTPSSGPAAFSDQAVAAFKHWFASNEVGQGQIKMIVTDEQDADWILDKFGDWLEFESPFGNPVMITPAGRQHMDTDKSERAANIRSCLLMCQDKFKGLNVRLIAQQHDLLSMD